MDTPTRKRDFDELSPVSDTEQQEAKRQLTKQVTISSKMADINSNNTPNNQDNSGLVQQFESLSIQMATMNKNIENMNITMNTVSNQLGKLDVLAQKAMSTAEEAKNKSTIAEIVAAEAKEEAKNSSEIAKETRERTDEIDSRLFDLECEVRKLKKEAAEKEDYSRKRNLKLDGLKEETDETDKQTQEKVHQFFQTQLGITNPKNIVFQDCHRLPRYPVAINTRGQARTIIMQFNMLDDRKLVWGKRRLLAGSKLFLKEDFCKATEQARKTLYPYVKAARISGEKHALVGGKLIIGNKQITPSNLQDMPRHIDPVATATRESDDAVVFYGKDSYLSNFHYAPFTVDMITYHTTEQFFHTSVAEHYKDDRTAGKIKIETDPGRCKYLSRYIKNFNQKDYENVAPKLMMEANNHKYEQNPELAEKLLNTGNKKIGEAAIDTFWAIGKSIWDKSVFTDWSGKNNMGTILERVRENLKAAK